MMNSWSPCLRFSPNDFCKLLEATEQRRDLCYSGGGGGYERDARVFQPMPFSWPRYQTKKTIDAEVSVSQSRNSVDHYYFKAKIKDRVMEPKVI